MSLVGRSFVLAEAKPESESEPDVRELEQLSFDDLIRGARTAVAEQPTPPRRRTRPVVRFFGILLLSVGVIGGAAGALFPDQIEWLYGEIKGSFQHAEDQRKTQEFNGKVEGLVGDDGRIDIGALDEEQQDQLRDTAKEAFPSVSLGVHGGQAQLDWCDGTFTVMDAYESDGNGDAARRIPPTAAAHNSCGGDVLLTWEVGQRVNLAGQGYDGLYEVVEIRHTSKVWSSTADLEGLAGDVALQSCFYGVDRMKFVGLQHVAEL